MSHATASDHAALVQERFRLQAILEYHMARQAADCHGSCDEVADVIAAARADQWHVIEALRSERDQLEVEVTQGNFFLADGRVELVHQSRQEAYLRAKREEYSEKIRRFPSSASSKSVTFRIPLGSGGVRDDGSRHRVDRAVQHGCDSDDTGAYCGDDASQPLGGTCSTISLSGTAQFGLGAGRAPSTLEDDINRIEAEGGDVCMLDEIGPSPYPESIVEALPLAAGAVSRSPSYAGRMLPFADADFGYSPSPPHERPTVPDRGLTMGIHSPALSDGDDGGRPTVPWCGNDVPANCTSISTSPNAGGCVLGSVSPVPTCVHDDVVRSPSLRDNQNTKSPTSKVPITTAPKTLADELADWPTPILSGRQQSDVAEEANPRSPYRPYSHVHLLYRMTQRLRQQTINTLAQRDERLLANAFELSMSEIRTVIAHLLDNPRSSCAGRSAMLVPGQRWPLTLSDLDLMTSPLGRKFATNVSSASVYHALLPDHRRRGSFSAAEYEENAFFMVILATTNVHVAAHLCSW
eukprot:PhM_4_TR14756/c1_g1_i1/m.70191